MPTRSSSKYVLFHVLYDYFSPTGTGTGTGLIILYFPGAGGIAIVTGALCNTVL